MGFRQICLVAIVVMVISFFTYTDSASAPVASKSIHGESGKSVTIECDAKKFIKITSAKYAAVDSSTDACNGVKDATTSLSRKCNGKVTCSFKAATDPKIKDCKWTPRPLDVVYACLDNPPTSVRAIGGADGLVD